jgi:hypothetical protein
MILESIAVVLSCNKLEERALDIPNPWHIERHNSLFHGLGKNDLYVF